MKESKKGEQSAETRRSALGFPKVMGRMVSHGAE
jgi:hypothetical protein